MRVLVTGPRDWQHVQPLADVLAFYRTYGGPKLVIIQGGARGADSVAAGLADAWGVRQEIYYADWRQHGSKAGPIRNAEMLKEGFPDLVVACRYVGEDWTRGTGDMVRRAEAAGVFVTTVYAPRG